MLRDSGVCGTIAWIRERVAGTTPPGERERLVEVVETELMCLHEGSIARYKLKPSEFNAWQATRKIKIDEAGRVSVTE